MKRIFIVVVLLAAGGMSWGQGFEKVKVEEGWISGSEVGGIHIFKGIPFAAPPVGVLRWRAPQPAAPWNGVRDCTQFGPSPMQNKPAPFLMWPTEYLIPEKSISEDCLYLNVWTPAGTAKERRPVLVYIYGGAFTGGGGNVPIYDGEAVAKKGVVYVTINYRLGIFGFFAYPELTRESGHQASGNYALMDQIAALKWVKANIAAFGGDPNNVTIAGQSAGSMSVNCLVASPLAKGLFGKAIGESGADFGREYVILARAEADGQKIAQKLGVALGAGSGARMGAVSLDSLRAIPAEELQKKGQGTWRPVIDGYVLPEPIADIFLEKKENIVALLTGWNQDEGFVFGPAKNAADYKQGITKQYGADAEAVLKYYPADNDSVAGVSQLYLSRDMTFGRQNYSWAVMTSAQGQKVFVYRFVRKPPTAAGERNWGAFHTGEVPYAYDNLKFVKRPFEPVDYHLSDEMSSYWVNFAKTGDPNGAGLPRWEAFSREGGKIMLLDRQSATGVLPDRGALEWWYNRMIKN
jgi:para-nitrobenzyl esterase